MSLTEVDRNLLERCLARQPGAWKDFVDRFVGLFVHVITHSAHARTVRLRPEDVDDLCAEIFVTLVADDFAVLRRFRGNSSLATYLSVVARRIAVKEISRRRMAEAMGHVSAHAASLEQAQARPLDAQRLENREQVQQLLAVLPPEDADIVRQFHLEGKSYREIAKGTGVPVNTIGSTLSRAREKMRQGEPQS